MQGDTCPSEMPSLAPSSQPSVSACTIADHSCIDKDGNTGIAVCTFHDQGNDPNLDDFPEDHHHNFCDTEAVELVPGVDESDGRLVVACGCCDEALYGPFDTEGGIKNSKKGAHCADTYTRRNLEDAEDTPDRFLTAVTSSKVSRRGPKNLLRRDKD